MRINIKQTIKDYAGKVVTQPKLDDQNRPLKDENNKLILEPHTLRDLLTTALNNVAPNETLKAEQKAKIYQLTLKIWAENEVDLTFDDRAFLKERVNLILISPMLCGRICDILEGDEKPASDSKGLATDKGSGKNQ